MKLRKVNGQVRKAFYSQISTKGLQICIDYLSIPDTKGISIISNSLFDTHYLDVVDGDIEISKGTMIKFLLDNYRYVIAL